jgi:predicted metallopeptidase
MLHSGGVSALSWGGDCFENINKEKNNVMDLATLHKTFRNGLIAHGDYARAREVAILYILLISHDGCIDG